MGYHEARVRKLIATFSELTDAGKNTILEQTEALRQRERMILDDDSKDLPFADNTFQGIPQLKAADDRVI